jgi:transposase
VQQFTLHNYLTRTAILLKQEVAVMCNKLEERKTAIFMYHVQHLSKAEICRHLKRSRPWLDRWLERYDPSDVEGSLSDDKTGPKQGSNRRSSAIRQQVIAMRKARSREPQWRYAFIGAQAIHLELKALNSPEVPPLRTIHHWFVNENLVDRPAKRSGETGETKPIPLPEADAVNRVQQLDLKGPTYLTGRSTKYYLAALRDRYSHRCALTALEGKGAQGIVNFLVAAWQWLGLPEYLQLDNALQFRGSNRYPRSFGRLVRIAVDLNVEPVFNLPAHDGLTPNELAAQADLRLPPKDYSGHLSKTLPQDRGFVSFVRLVRKSGRITLCAGDRFMVDPNLAYQYVLARVGLAQGLVTITHNDQKIQVYDYSDGTVGQWAMDEQPGLAVDDKL